MKRWIIQYWYVGPLLLLLAAMAALALSGCKSVVRVPFMGEIGGGEPTVPPTAGEAATYAALIKMALGAFFPGVACLIAGVVASVLLPPLKVLSSIGTMLMVVGISSGAACLLLDRYGGWTAAILLFALAGGLAMWLINQWRESGWKKRLYRKAMALRAAGNISEAAALEMAVNV